MLTFLTTIKGNFQTDNEINNLIHLSVNQCHVASKETLINYAEIKR